MALFDTMKNTVEKGKNAVSGYFGNLKSQEAHNNKMIEMPMEERIKERGEGVRYCLINSLGKIMDVYDNKVIFTSTNSTSNVVFSLLMSTGEATRGQKTIYYKDAIGVQYKPS